MGPNTFGEWMTLGSLVVAVLALSTGFSRSSQESHERDQVMRDRLDSLREQSTEQLRMLRELDAKLDDHGTRITRMEEQVQTLFDRITRLEKEHDRRVDIPPSLGGRLTEGSRDE